MKNIFLLFIILSFVNGLSAATFEIVYSISDGKVRKVYEVINGPSILPLKETKRLTQKVIRLTEVPQDITAIAILGGSIVKSQIQNCLLVKPNLWPQISTEQLYTGPDGRYINFETRKYQEGVINVN